MAECPPNCDIASRWREYENWRDEQGCLIARNDLPFRVFNWFHEANKVDRAELRYRLSDAWIAAEWPARFLDTYEWAEMFYAAGYFSDCQRVRRPRAARQLWRGCTVGHETGMSWTDNRAKAEWFAHRYATNIDSVIVSAHVPASAILARFVHGRNEAEWVVDPWWLGVSADVVVTPVKTVA